MLSNTERALLRRVATEQASNRAPSLIAGVVRDGALVWSGGRGYVDGQRPDTGTQYRLGSITKSMIAALTLRLRDEGRLDLDDRVDQHLSDTDVGSATIAQLLRHTAGLAAEAPGLWWERSGRGNWDELAATLTPSEAKHRPGHRFHYSNLGYGVLGELIGRLRGTDWLAALRTEILDPLGLSHTTDHPRGRRAQGWAVHPYADVVLPEPSPDTGAMGPAGQLWSTIDDLARWTAFIGGHSGQVLHPDTVAEMREVATVDDGDLWTTGYGLGCQLVRYAGRRLAGHSGSMPGFLACAMIEPATQTGALAFANTTSGVGMLSLVLDLITITDEHEPRLPAEWRPTKVDPALLELTGTWHWGPTPFTLCVLAQGWLWLAPAAGNGPGSRLRPLADDVWEGLDGYFAGETLRIVRSSSGQASHLELATFVFTRTPYDRQAPIPGGVDPHGWRGGQAGTDDAEAITQGDLTDYGHE